MARKKRVVDVSGITPPDMDAAIIRPGGVEEVFKPTVIPDYQDKAVQVREQEQYQEENAPSLLDLPRAAINSSWVEPALYRASERNAESRDFVPDPDFKVTNEHLDRLDTQYNLENRSYLKESTSQQDFAARQRWVNEDLTRKQAVGAYGVTGMFAEFAATLLDPAMLPLMVATGGSSFLASASRFGKMGRAALSFGAQGGVLEGALVAGDTQKSGKDFLAGLVGGAVLGGAFGAATRLSPKAASLAHDADLLDQAMSKDAKWMLEQDAVDIDRPAFLRKRENAFTEETAEGMEAALVGRPAPEAPSNIITAADLNMSHPSLKGRLKRGADADFPAEATIVEGADATSPTFNKWTEEHVALDADEITRSTDVHRKNLEAKGKMDMTGRAGSALKKELASKAEIIRADLAEMAQTLIEHRATVAAAHGAVRNAEDAATLAYRLQGIEHIYAPAMERAQAKLDTITERLAAAREARGSREALKAFDAKSRVEQIHEIFPEGAPKTRSIVEGHRFALNEVSAVSAAQDTERATATLDILEPLQEAADGAASLTRETTAAKVAERAAKVEALVERSTTGQTTKEFINSLIDKAVSRGKSAVQWLPFQALRDRIQGAFTTLDSSKNEAFRGINFMVHEAPQAGFIPEQTAAQFQDIYLKQIRTQEMHGWTIGFNSWSRDQGRNEVAAALNTEEHKAIFDTEVFLKVFNPERETHAGITQAADAHRAGLKKALQIRQDAGEMGFADIEGSLNYMPIIFDSNSIVHMAAKSDRKQVVQLVSKSYQYGKFRLDPKSADLMAEMQIRRAESHQLSGNQVFKNVVSESEKAAFAANLKKHGVPEEFIVNLLEERETADLMSNISNRAKFSLGLNPETELDGLRMVDLLNTDTTVLTQNYYRESAGGAALAKKGFKSFEHYNRVVNEAEHMGLKLGLDPKRNKEEAELLRDAGKQLYGRPLNEDADGLLDTSLRRGMSWIALRALGMLGFAQMPETGRAMAMFGAKEVMENIPSVAIFRRKSARVGGGYSGVLHDPINRDIEFALGYQGEDKLFAPMHIRGESFQGISDPSGRIGKILDNTLALGGNVQNVVSGFQATQGAMEKVAVRVIYKKLIRMAEGEVPFGSSRMTDEVGWTKEWFEEFKTFHNSHQKTDQFNGESIRLIDHEAMSVQMKDTFLIGMNRLRGRAIQANFIGEFSPWIEKTLGKPLSQFRRFSIVSTEKQLIHDLNGDKIQAAQTLAWSSMIALMSYSTRAHIRSWGEDDPEKYLEKAFDPAAVGYGVFNFLPQTAGVSLFMEAFGALGGIPDRFQSAPGRTGIPSKYSPPVLSGITDPIKTFHDVVQAADGTGTAHDAAKSMLRLLPFQNAIGVGYLRKQAADIFE